MNAKKDRIEMEPVQDVDELYLKFKGKITSGWEKLV